MKLFSWLLKAAIFFVLFAFALGNGHEVALHVWPGNAWQVPMMVVVLASFALGCVLGIAVMLPRLWRSKRAAQVAAAQQAQQAAPQAPAVVAAPAPAAPDAARHMTDPSLPITPES